MASYQIQEGTYISGGFGPFNFHRQFMDWVSGLASAGGANWYVIEDQSSLGTLPYIVVSDVEDPSPNEVAKILRVEHYNNGSNDYVNYYCYSSWDTVTPTGYGLWFKGRVQISDLKTQSIPYDFRGGPEILYIGAGPTVTDAYCFFFEEWEGLTNLVEAPHLTGTLQSGASSGNFINLQLGTGEAANFSSGYFYYIYDFDGVSNVDYTKCTSINTSTDVITIDPLNKDFAAGAVIGSYPHRFYAACSHTTGGVNEQTANIPYCSAYNYPSRVFHDQEGAVQGGASLFFEEEFLEQFYDPTDRILVARPYVLESYGENESSQTSDMDRVYGRTKNIFIAHETHGMSVGDRLYLTTSGWQYKIVQETEDVGYYVANCEVLLRDTTSLT